MTKCKACYHKKSEHTGYHEACEYIYRDGEVGANWQPACECEEFEE